jgi:twinkle protein
MTAKEIAQKLAQQADAVCRMLLPDGKREGQEWRAGSVGGEKGKSLGVHLSGTKAGVWADFNGGAGGDLLDLWAQTKGVTIGEAIREAKAYLGIHEPEFAGYRKPVFRRPEKPECSRPRGNVARYLANRGIEEKTLAAYRVAASKDDEEIIFPYLRDGELVNVKYLKLERINNKKQIRLEKDCEACLFGWQAIPENTRTVALCEGEIDALTLWQFGIPALSVFSGAGNHTWIENEYERLERFDEIFVCFDRDEAGEKGCRELVERLGRERCRVVNLPYKDANECLRQDMDAEAMRDVFAAAKYCDPVELRNASEYVDDVIREFYPAEGEPTGFYTPWQKLNGKLKFRPAEMIIVNGINGHGKSMIVSNLVLEAMKQGEKVCIFSGELRPRITLHRMVKQCTVTAEPSIPYIRAVHDWFADKLWIFDVLGNAKRERMLEVFRYCKRRYGVTVFVVDSLLKCGIAEKDYDTQKLFAEQLADFKNETESTLFLVTHSRKSDSEYNPSDKMDIKGSGSIADLVDTILHAFRNKKIEQQQAAGEELQAPNVMLECQKQRNGDWEEKAMLWFDKNSYRYREAFGKPIVPYVSFSTAQTEGESIEI